MANKEYTQFEFSWWKQVLDRLLELPRPSEFTVGWTSDTNDRIITWFPLGQHCAAEGVTMPHVRFILTDAGWRGDGYQIQIDSNLTCADYK